MTQYNVLDHGYVRLVEHVGSDLSIVRAARNSYNAEPRLDGSDTKLIHYLLKNKHTSPFEAVMFTFDVKAPIFIFRQWHRHRTWSYNELSGRYAELPEEFYIPLADHVGSQSEKNKQVRNFNQGEDHEFIEELLLHSKKGFELYHKHLSRGVPREVARLLLGVNVYSRMFATVDLHNLLHFIRLRIDSHAQWEIQQYAKALLDLITPIVPDTVDYFKTTL